MKLPVFYAQIVAYKADLMRVQGEGDEERRIERVWSLGAQLVAHGDDSGKEMSCT